MKVYGLGCNYFGQLGVERTTPPHVPIELSLTSTVASDGEEIDDIQCGGQFSLALTKKGKMYISGTVNGAVYARPQLVQLQYPLKTTQVACGRKHILALLEGGFVASWGIGYFGQLGHDDDASLDFPRIISDLEPRALGAQVVKIACGGSHSAALANDGRLFMWGLNKNGQCGLNIKQDSLLRPCATVTSTLHNERIVDIVCGRNHSGLLTDNNNVYTWGGTSYGRLGVVDIRKAAIPALVETMASLAVVRIASGDMHMLALTREGEVYSWGYNAEGQCGHGNTLHLRTPRRIEVLRHHHIVDIACGSTYSFAITASGGLLSWGYGDGGWLGLDFTEQELEALPFIEPELESGRVAHSCTKSFESRLNVLMPERVRYFEESSVVQVRAGGGHTIVFVEQTPAGKHSKGTVDTAALAEDHLNYDWNVAEDVEKIMSLCRHNRLEAIQELIDSGLPTEIRDVHGNTPLLHACQNGHQELARFLLERGADINAVNESGNTCLHYAFAYGFQQLGDWLVMQGADEYYTNREGLTCYEGLTSADLEKF